MNGRETKILNKIRGAFGAKNPIFIETRQVFAERDRYLSICKKNGLLTNDPSAKGFNRLYPSFDYTTVYNLVMKHKDSKLNGVKELRLFYSGIELGLKEAKEMFEYVRDGEINV